MKRNLMSLVCAGTVFGCASCDDSTTSSPVASQPANKYFADFGIIDDLHYFGERSATVAAGDFDGDGDIDFVLVTGNSEIILYENKMPQKGVYNAERK